MTAKIGLELSTEDLQRSTLANTVGSDQAENLPRAGHRKPMKLETVGSITVRDLTFEVGWQVDDGDGVEWTLLGADTTTDTERLGDEGQAGLGGDFNTKLSAADDRAGLFAFLATLPWTTLFW